MRLVLALALGMAACVAESEDARVARYAELRLGVPASALRVTSQSDLTGAKHNFYLVTGAGQRLIVIAPRSGALFDSRTGGAFSRVAHDEDAARRLGQLGAERIAGWFAALGGGVCPAPPADDAHFATVTPAQDGGVRVSYAAPSTQGITTTCLIELAPDGTLRQARAIEEPRALSPVRWRSDAD
jgi:hypothetical protein